MDYFDNVRNAIVFIEKNLTHDINIEVIAKEAYYSPYHFMRIFYQLTGLSPGEYLRLRRLSEASKELLNGRSIIETAFLYQFSSQEAFSRSFKKAFGVTPKEYITTKKKIEIIPAPEPNKHSFTIGERTMNKEPKIETLKEKKIIGYPYYGINTRIPEMWERFDKYYNICEKKPPYYGFMFNFGHNKAPWEFVYMPAIEVSSLDKEMPLELVGKIIPASTWALFYTEVNKIGEAIDYAKNKWLPSSEYVISMNAELEIYTEKKEPCCCYYCFPVKKKPI